MVARLALAAVLLTAGLLKVSDLGASARAVNAYELMPWSMAQVVGAALPMLEIGVGLLLLAGAATRLAAWLTAIMMGIFIAGIVSAWARGLSIDCGCFSSGGALPVGQTPDYSWEIARDLGLLGLAIFLIVFPASRFSVDGRVGRGQSTVEV